MKPNVGKYKFQIIGTKNQLSKINDIKQIKLDIGEECIRPEDTVVNLGMTLDQHLSWRPHVERLWKESIGKLRQLKSIRECMPREIFKDLVNCVVLSKVEYGNIVYGNANKGVQDIVQRIQNAAAKTVTKSRKFDHVTPLLDELNWLRMSDRCYLQRCSLLYKCLNGDGPTYLSDKLIPLSYKHNYRTRSAANGHLAIPKPRTNSKIRSFEYWAPVLWNSLVLGKKQI